MLETILELLTYFATSLFNKETYQGIDGVDKDGKRISPSLRIFYIVLFILGVIGLLTFLVLLAWSFGR